jgi:predicted NUDIX family NTP pyrophosphohydrolase
VIRQTGRMVAKRSAGILVHRTGVDGAVEVLIGHMGGPFFTRKDDGGWSIPKGEYEPPESAEAAARREFTEELGLPVPPGELVPLGDVKQSSGKVVTVWALAGDLDPAAAVPGTFDLEWPPRSGRIQQFPELDRVAWFTLPAAGPKLVAYQRPFLDRLADHLAGHPAG